MTQPTDQPSRRPGGHSPNRPTLDRPTPGRGAADGPPGDAPLAAQVSGALREAARPEHRLARTHLAGDLLEQFFVSAVVAVLGIRIYLQLTGFPQVGGGTLHIAHLLWGGLGMLVALTLALTFLGRRVRTWVAILGGLGFGTFIDELGKFITADNDYFYRPAWVVIYAIFIVMFFAFTALTRRQRPVGPPALATAMDMVLDASLYGLRPSDREVILRLLDDAGDAPLARALRDTVADLPLARDHQPGIVTRAQDRLRDGYRAVTRAPLFRVAVVALWSLFTVTGAVVTLVGIVRDPDFGPASPSLGATDLIQTAVVVVSGALALVGITRLARSRLAAYGLFRLAILVSLLVGQPLAFFDQAILATGGLLVDLVCLGAFNYGISVEMADREERHPDEDDHTPGFLGAPAGEAG